MTLYNFTRGSFFIPGIVGDILLNNVPLRNFTVYSLDMTSSFINRFLECYSEYEPVYIEWDCVNSKAVVFSLYRAPWRSFPHKPSFPAFLQGRLFVDGYPSDTFIKLPVSDMCWCVFSLKNVTSKSTTLFRSVLEACINKLTKVIQWSADGVTWIFRPDEITFKRTWNSVWWINRKQDFYNGCVNFCTWSSLINTFRHYTHLHSSWLCWFCK